MIFKAKMQEGKRVSPSVPYGYIRDPKDKMRMNVAEGCALIDKYNPHGVLPKLVEMGRVIETRKGLYHVSEATRALLLEFDRETKADTCNAICEVLPLT